MKKHLKWIIPIICIVLIAALGAGYFARQQNRIPTEIKYIHSNTTINTNNPREVVGSQVYVFVGFVEETHDYMTEKNKRTFPKIVLDVDVPHTECVVKVIKNIKGNLTENISFSFFKSGGISEDREYIQLHENDLIPETGKYYVFTGYAHADGSVTGGGPNGTIALEENINADNIEESAIYQKYANAYKNQILPTTDSGYPVYFAKEDKNYGDGSYNASLYKEYQEKQAEIEKKSQAQLAQFENDISEKEKSNK